MKSFIFLLLLCSVIFAKNVSFVKASAAQTVSNAGSYSPDGGDEVFTAADHADFDFGQHQTVCSFVKAAAGANDPFTVIMGQWEISASDFQWAWETDTGDDEWRVLIGEDDPLTVFKLYESNLNIWDNGWDWICHVWDGTFVGPPDGELKLYVNGSEITPVKSTDSSFDTMSNLAIDFSAGGEEGGNTTYGFTGFIDETMVWTSSLSDMEISALWNAMDAGSNLVADPTKNGGGYISKDTLIQWYRYESDSNCTTANGILDASGSATTHHGTGSNLEAGDCNDSDIP